MFRKGGLSQETGIMSGLDRRGYAGGGNIGGGSISGNPMGSRTGFQDNRWERYGRNLRNWYSNLGKSSRAAGVRGPGFTMSPPYTGSTLPVPYSKPPLLSERGLTELAKKIGTKGAGIMSAATQRFPAISKLVSSPWVSIPGAAISQYQMTKPEEYEKEYGISQIEKALLSNLPGTQLYRQSLAKMAADKKSKEVEELEPPITKSDADFETTDDIESDLMRAYEERLPVIEKALAGRPSTKSQWLALAKFGAGLAAEPGGDLIGAIGRAAKIPLDDLAKLQEKMEDKKTQAKLLALQGALDVTKPGEIARKVNDVQKLLNLKGKEGKKAAFAIVDRWVSGDRASRASDTKAYRETAKELRVNAAGFLESMEDLKEKHPKLVSKLGITTERLPDLDDLEDDATPGEYYINKEGNILRYDPNREPPLLEPGDKGFEGKWKKKK